MSARVLLERIDHIVGELEQLRTEVQRLVEDAALTDTHAHLEAGEPADDFAECNLIDCQSASQRFNYPADTLRKWARQENCGKKIGGRWLISTVAVRRRLNGS